MHPILFEFGIITIFSLWFFIALGFVAGAYLFVHLAKRLRVRLNVLAEHGVFIFLSTLIAARVVFVTLNYTLYFHSWDFWSLFSPLALWDKGLSFWGAVAGWIVSVIYITKEQRELRSNIFDLAIPSLFVGMIFGSFGAFLDGINYGSPTEMPWGVVFRSANVKYISAIHPAQLYAIFYLLLLAGFSYVLIQKLRGRLPGLVLEVGAFFFGLFRFIEEFFRGDETVVILGVRFPFIASIAAVGISSYLIYLRYKSRRGSDPDQLVPHAIDNILRSLVSLIKKRRSPKSHQTPLS